MKKKLLMLLALVMVIGCLAGCEYEETSASQETDYTQELKSQAHDTVGLPNISNFFEMTQLKSIYELRDDPNLICYWYTKNEYSGKWIYQGTCIGYGIPYSTQITSPDTTIAEMRGHFGTSYTDSTAVAQAEPNGLYSSNSTSATWILTTDNDGNVIPTYVESEITVSQTKIESRLCEDWSIPNDY